MSEGVTVSEGVPVHCTFLPGKTAANLFCVFQDYIQRKRQRVYKGNGWHKDKFFLFVSPENNE